MMTAMPVASPSIPSKKLNALVMPTIHSTVSSTLSASPQTLCGKKVRSLPAQMTIAAAAIWTTSLTVAGTDRKSTRLNSSHLVISYAVFCLKKKRELHQLCYRHHSHKEAERIFRAIPGDELD